MSLATTTIRSGEMTAQQIHGAPPVPSWVPVVDHVLDRLPSVIPSVATKLGKGPGGHVVALWIVVAAMAAGGALHIVGDGTLRAQVERTECHVEWLVSREIARDRGEAPPAFSPLACSGR